MDVCTGIMHKMQLWELCGCFNTGKWSLRSSGSFWIMQWDTCTAPRLRFCLEESCNPRRKTRAQRALQVWIDEFIMCYQPILKQYLLPGCLNECINELLTASCSFNVSLWLNVRVFRCRCESDGNRQQEHCWWWEITEVDQGRYRDAKRARSGGSGTSETSVLHRNANIPQSCQFLPL